MQVMTCRVNEGLIVGENISVTVLDIFEDHVRLGISSPNAQPSYWEQMLYWKPAECTAELQLQ